MAEGEKIDLVKAVTSPFTGLYWVKTIMYCLGASALIFIGLGVKKAYFTKPPDTSTTEQKAEEIINYNYQNPRVTFGCMRFFPIPKEVPKEVQK